MTIQLPNHLVVAGAAGVKIGNPPKVTKPRFNSAKMIAPPRHLRPGLNGQAKNRKMVRSNLLGKSYDFAFERSATETGNYSGGFRQRESRRQFRIKLEGRWICESVGILQLLSNPNCNLSKGAQLSHSTGRLRRLRTMRRFTSAARCWTAWRVPAELPC